MPLDGIDGTVIQDQDQLVTKLEAMRAHIIEHGWCQDKLFDHEGRVCLRGAMHRVGVPIFNMFDWSSSMDEVISDTIGGRGSRSFARNVVDWNNAPGRTQGEVLTLIDRTIARLTLGHKDDI